MGSFFYCTVIHALLLEEIQSLLNSEQQEGKDGQVLFYIIDNGYILCRRNKLFSVLDLLLSKGRQYGFSLNIDKSDILMGYRSNENNCINDTNILQNTYGFKLEGNPNNLLSNI